MSGKRTAMSIFFNKPKPEFPEFFCRTAYCEHCARARRPQIHQAFMAVGSTNQGKQKRFCDRVIAPSEYGFTPHLFQVTDVQKYRDNVTIVFFKKLCLMENCGVVFFRFQDGQPGHHFNEHRSVVVSLDYKDAKALLLLANSGYELDWQYWKKHRGAIISPLHQYRYVRNYYKEKTA